MSTRGTPARRRSRWHRFGVFVAGLLIGLVGLGSAATHFTRRAAAHAENPLVLAAHHRDRHRRAQLRRGFGDRRVGGVGRDRGGASRSSSASALHNATEGFGVAAPLVGRVVPTWAQIGLAGLIAGGPTFVGTIFGYTFYSPMLSVFFLAIAVGALVFVIGELWSVLRRTGLTALGHRDDVRRFLDRAGDRTLPRHQRRMIARAGEGERVLYRRDGGGAQRVGTISFTRVP